MLTLFVLLDFVMGPGRAGFDLSGPHFSLPSKRCKKHYILLKLIIYNHSTQSPHFLSYTLTFLVHRLTYFAYVEISYIITPSYKQRSATSFNQG